MNYRFAAAILCVLFASAAVCGADNMLTNGSFEQGTNRWTVNPSYTVLSKTSGWEGVTAADGNKFLVIQGPVDPGYAYADLISQSKYAPFGYGMEDDNFVVYLYGAVYVHTNDGRDISCAFVLEPGYGGVGSAFRRGGNDEWVPVETSGTYSAHDPLDPDSPEKPLKVLFQLRDSLAAGEFVAFDAAYLVYGGAGVWEASSVSSGSGYLWLTGGVSAGGLR